MYFMRDLRLDTVCQHIDKESVRHWSHSVEVLREERLLCSTHIRLQILTA